LERFAPGFAVGAVAGFVVGDLNFPTLLSLPGERGYLFAGSALLGVLLWRGALRHLVSLGTALLVLLWLAVSFTPLTARLADGLVRRDAITDADAVFVFASKMQQDGDPYTDATSRLLKGVELIAAGARPTSSSRRCPPRPARTRCSRAPGSRRSRTAARWSTSARSRTRTTRPSSWRGSAAIAAGRASWR
jgi:hypothetical protein